MNMATGVVIRLQNLPLVAGTIDIRHYFGGLKIPDGGVHIIGGDDGTAFILFATDEDARQAMLRDAKNLCGATIRLMLSSHSEMKKVIEDSQRICEELRGLRPPEPPITNLTGRSVAPGYPCHPKHYMGKPPSPEQMVATDVYLEVKGLPFDASENDVLYFFAPVRVLDMRFLLDEARRRSGTVLVKFKSAIDKLEGLKKDGKFVEGRFVKVSPISERRWLMFGPPPDQLYGPDRKRPSSSASPNAGTPKRSRAFSPLRSDNCVEIRGLPSNTTYKTINEFFSGLRLVDGGLFVEHDNKVCKGRAFAEFSIFPDYKQALLKDGDMVNGKQVRVIGLSKPNMLEQIRIHRKYIKAKQYEERSREKEKKHEKKLKEERKREHQLKKQKEMEDWLRRQHQKEEDERKRLDLEKKAIALNNEGQQKINEDKLDAPLPYHEKQNQEEQLPLGDQHELEEKRRYLQQQLQIIAEKSKDEEQYTNDEKGMISIKEEPVLGAGEMDIEDDVQAGEIAPAMTNSTTVTGDNTAPSSFGFPPVFGASGGVVGTQPVPFSSVPVVSPRFGLTGLPANFAPPLAVPRLPGASPIPGIPNPPVPPPLPSAVIPPPPTPPILMKPVTPIPAHSVVTKEETVKKLRHSLNNRTVATPYVRVANSPFRVTEHEIREFFAGLNIQGIQFVERNNRRTGQVYIKFFSAEEAAKAVEKDDHTMLDRSVKVEASTLANLSAHYRKVTGEENVFPMFSETESQGFNLPGSSGINRDDGFIQNIFKEQLTCVCIGNVPFSASTNDVLLALPDINIRKGGIHILEDSASKCKGKVYVELVNPEVCAKVISRKAKLTILGSSVQIWPVSFMDMKADVEMHNKYLNAEFGSADEVRSRALNSAPDIRFHSPNFGPLPMSRPSDSTLNNIRQPIGAMLPPRDSSHLFDPMLRSREARHPFDPFIPGRESSLPAVDPRNITGPISHPPPREFPPFSMDGRKPPFNPDLGRPRSPMINELVRFHGCNDKPRQYLPNMLPALGPPPRFPGNGHPLPANIPSIVTVKMGNLNFKVTQEDIIEFFWGFDPIPDSVRLMYDKLGRPTGDGVISFPNQDAARAAVDKLHGRRLLERSIKLYLQ